MPERDEEPLRINFHAWMMDLTAMGKCLFLLLVWRTYRCFSQVSNEGKELKVRGRKLIVGQFLGVHPSDFVTANRGRRTVQPRTLKKVKGDGLGLIGVIDLNEVCDGLHLHAQFFADLSFNTGFQALSGFLLSARKLPVPAKMAFLRPSRNENLSVFPDQTCGHMKMMFRHCYHRTYLPKQDSHHRDTEDTEKIFYLSGDTDKQK